ncbi:RpL37A [Cordylochernes scorpioides]|uniref:RpL37A n=1 Tax=Cordylochernes scorpioides TaxID=51811 RepID=A0ABY6L7Z1_9ARAC|nr:RpL37A [Cordylochernes scorpioides]
MIKKIEISQHKKYTCSFCGKNALKRKCVGIWHCRACTKTVSGGAYVPITNAAHSVRSAIRRLREMQEQ